ncbi:MAG: YggS family pyridoxal phosphate-dependent enzyme [Phycisphaeraceae bacterium]|nr:YggS family pyridoxal phosphate-dependent enzyme [Phycisphaeraceae bacterium]
MTTAWIPGPQQLQEAYRQVTGRIAEAATRSGRRPEDVLLVAVTKTASPDQIRLLAEMGHVDFAENRVQQLEKRAPALTEFLSRKKSLGSTSTREVGPLGACAEYVRWHMIGQLHRNKAKSVTQLVKLIHSVDSLRLAEELHALGSRMTEPIQVLIQVNASGELSKGGVVIPAVMHLADQIATMVNLRPRGLMTMAPYSDNPEESRHCFARTAEVFEEIRTARIGGGDFNILSMGMSNDFEVAIQEGANLVRVGRALFGDEEYL